MPDRREPERDEGGERPCLAGAEVVVDLVRRLLADGWTPDEVRTSYGDLLDPDVLDAILTER